MGEAWSIWSGLTKGSTWYSGGDSEIMWTCHLVVVVGLECHYVPESCAR